MNTLTTLTVIAISVAAAMTALVLRLVFEERRRSAARVAALEADIYRTEEEDILVLHDPPSLERSGGGCSAIQLRRKHFPLHRLWRFLPRSPLPSSPVSRDIGRSRPSRSVRRRHRPPIRCSSSFRWITSKPATVSRSAASFATLRAGAKWTTSPLSFCSSTSRGDS